jgi:hypothetical protein
VLEKKDLVMRSGPVQKVAISVLRILGFAGSLYIQSKAR